MVREEIFMEIKLQAAIDSGNSENAMIVDGQLTRLPSVVSKSSKNPFYDELELDSAVRDIFKQLVVSIDSPAVTPGIYLVGEYAIENSTSYINTEVGAEEKHTSEVPVTMAFGMLAAKAVQEAYKKDPQLDSTIKATVDMATGLPVREYSKATGEKFAERFMKGIHKVQVHLGSDKTVSVELDFDFVKVFSEAVPVIFSLVNDVENNIRKGEIFAEFQKKYGKLGIDGSHFLNKRILHTDIGEGTTELPITEGFKPNQKLSDGKNFGIGHATETILDDYSRVIRVSSTQRHAVSKVLKNKEHKYYDKAINLMENPLESQADQILRAIKKQIDVVQNELDLVVVYGGGSILLKKFLEPKADLLCSDREIQLFYVPEEFAPTLFVEGLAVTFVNGVFEKIKAAHMAKNPVNS